MFFLMLHILGTMQSTVMCKTVFIKNPKSVGFFDGMDDSKESKKKKWIYILKNMDYSEARNLLNNKGSPL